MAGTGSTLLGHDHGAPPHVGSDRHPLRAPSISSAKHLRHPVTIFVMGLCHRAIIGQCRERLTLMVINGKAWPNTERLETRGRPSWRV